MRSRAIVQSWTVYPFGCVEVLMQKQILGDNDVVLSSHPHRTSLNPDTDIDAQEAAVKASIAALGFGELEGDGWAQMKAQALAVRDTPEAKAWLAEKQTK